jgi:nucleoside-diphosphate-sugar epimerase
MAMFLVTGGAGFIGSSIAEKLLANGDRVRVLDDFSTGRRQNLEALKGDVEVIEGSIVDPAIVAKAVKGVEVVFHEAAIPSVARSVENPPASMLANVQGTTVVLDAARRAGVRRLIFAASSSAYGDTPTLPKVETMTPAPLSPYAVSKLTAEHLLRVFASLYGIETLSLRYFNVFGPRQDPTSQYAAVIPNFITAAIRRTRPVVYGDGEQTRDFCFIDNTVNANLLAATTPNKLSGEVVNVACGERISLNQLLGYIGDEAGHKLEAEYKPGRAGDVRDSLADIGAARKLIGYEPKVLVGEGLKRTFAAFKTFTK